jgi:hypothetical protein
LNELIAQTKNSEVLESALRAQISSSFQSKNPQHQEAALKNYLNKGSDLGLKSKAQIDYVQFLTDQKRLPEAESFAQQIYNQSSDKLIAEQLLIIYNKTGQIEKEKQLNLKLADGKAESRHFKNYKKITLSQIQTKIESSKADRADLQTLVQIADSSQSPSEKFKILNDAFLIAIKERDFSNLKEIALKLSTLAPKLARKERDLALEKRILVADLELDFKNSLFFEKQLSSATSPALDFKIAIKSRLAGTPNLKLENQILNSSRFSNEQRLWILEQQLVSSTKPIKLLNIYSAILKDEESKSRLFLLCLRGDNTREANIFLRKNPSLYSSFAGGLLLRKHKIEQLATSFKTLGKTRAQRSSLQSFSQSLKQAVSQQVRFENRIQSESRDPVIFSVGLSFIQELRIFLKSDLEKAKKELKVSESIRKQFISRLDSEIQTLDQKINQTNQWILKLWATNEIKSEFASVVLRSSIPQRQAIATQVSHWRNQSLGTSKELISELLGIARNPLTDLASDYGSLKRNPFDVGTAQRLAKEEQIRGNYLVSEFLTARNNRLEGI